MLVLHFVGVLLLIDVSAHAGLHEVGDQVEVVLEKRKWCCSSRVACAVKSVCWVVLMRNIDKKGWSALCFCGSSVRQCLRPDALAISLPHANGVCSWRPYCSVFV